MTLSLPQNSSPGPCPGNFFPEKQERVDVIAHRGGAGEWPSETLFAFRKAKELGVDVLEMDVRSTSDDKLVLIHNPTLNETTNGNGFVRCFSLQELKKFDAGFYWTSDGGDTYPFRGLGITIPTLEETLSEFRCMRMNIEIKGWHPLAAKKLANRFCGLLKEHGMINRVLVASFHQPVISHIKRECPEIAVSASTRDNIRFVVSSRWGSRRFRPRADAVQTWATVFDGAIIDEDLVQMAKDLKIKLHGWTVNEVQDMKRLIDLGIDGIITDFPTRLMNLLPSCSTSVPNGLIVMRNPDLTNPNHSQEASIPPPLAETQADSPSLHPRS